MVVVVVVVVVFYRGEGCRSKEIAHKGRAPSQGFFLPPLKEVRERTSPISLAAYNVKTRASRFFSSFLLTLSGVAIIEPTRVA